MSSLKRKNLTTVITSFVFHLSFFFFFISFFFRYSIRPRIIFVLYRVTHTSFGTKAWGYFFLFFIGEKMYAQRKLILSFEKQRYVGKKKKKTGKKEKKRRKHRTVPKERIRESLEPSFRLHSSQSVFSKLSRRFETHIWTRT